jgi:glycosyltransferase involved in cell wall biosynthesis
LRLSGKLSAVRKPVPEMPEEQTAPVVSFCIPTYNRAGYLSAALSTILPQTARDIEVVVSDNGSDDGTNEIVTELQQKYPRLKYFRSETNLGYDRNLLRCVEMAAGEYLWLFGSDDQLKPGAVEAVRRSLRSKPAMVFVNHEVFTEQGEILLKRKLAWHKDLNFRSPEAYLAFIGMNFSFMTSLVLKRELCLQVQDMAEAMGTGWIHLYMVLWILAHGRSFRFLGYPYVRARARLVADYDTFLAFVNVNKIVWNAHKYGHAHWALYVFIGRTVIDRTMKLVAGERARGSRSARDLVPLLVRAYWMFPHFWLLVLPLCFLPQGLMVVLRGLFRRVRAWGWGGEPAIPT